MPADMDWDDLPAGAPDADIDASWEHPSQEAIDRALETQPLDVKAENTGATKRPLSLFGQR